MAQEWVARSRALLKRRLDVPLFEPYRFPS
jgi:hypothetical protein